MTPLELVFAGGLGLSLFANIAQAVGAHTSRRNIDKLHAHYSELWYKVHRYCAAVDYYFTNLSLPERKKAKALILDCRQAIN